MGSKDKCDKPTITKEGTSILDMRHVVCITEAAIAAELVCRICAALLNGLCLASPVSLLRGCRARGMNLSNLSLKSDDVYGLRPASAGAELCSCPNESHLAAHHALGKVPIPAL